MLRPIPVPRSTLALIGSMLPFAVDEVPNTSLPTFMPAPQQSNTSLPTFTPVNR